MKEGYPVQFVGLLKFGGASPAPVLLISTGPKVCSKRNVLKEKTLLLRFGRCRRHKQRESDLDSYTTGSTEVTCFRETFANGFHAPQPWRTWVFTSTTRAAKHILALLGTVTALG